MSAPDSDVDDLRYWRKERQRGGADLLASALGFLALLIASIVVWTKLGFGYGALVAIVGVTALMHGGWLALVLLGIVWWRGGRHDVLIALAAVAGAWWLARWILSWPLRWVLRVYDEERSSELTEIRGFTEPVGVAFEWLGPRDGAPVRTSDLLVALITTDQATRWGALADLVLRPGGTRELEAVTTLAVSNGPAVVTAATARAIRLSGFLGDAYELPRNAPLTALALVLEGPAARELLAGAGITEAEAIDLLQGDPIGTELEDLSKARSAFTVIETEAVSARAAASAAGGPERRPWRPRFVNTVAIVIGAFVLISAFGAAGRVPQVLGARDRLESGVADLKAGRTDEAIQNFALVAQDYPDSIAALTGLACPLWNMGYRDNAMLNFAGLLAAGFEPSGQPSNCFVTDPAGVDIRIVKLRIAVRPYGVNPDDPLDQELVKLLAKTAAVPASHWQAELVLACLNHRNGYRLVAGTNFQGAELVFAIADDDGEPVKTIDIPDECTDYAEMYRMFNSGLVLPPDAEQRFYVPDVSPVPPEYDNDPSSGMPPPGADGEPARASEDTQP